ncbi:MAG: chemotaxis protein CheX [Spirochaetota bacterium]
MELTDFKLSLKNENHDSDQIYTDISSTIGLYGSSKMALILTMSEQSVLVISENIMGASLSWEDNLVSDTMGEILNILVGVAQKDSPEKFSFSIPITIKGKEHEVRVPKKTYTKVTFIFSHEGKENEIALILVKLK